MAKACRAEFALVYIQLRQKQRDHRKTLGLEIDKAQGFLIGSRLFLTRFPKFTFSD